MSKKYYWLKLHKDFFKRHDVRIIESMPNGKEYVLFYMKLLLESVDHEGTLRFSDTIPYNDLMLSTITNTNIDIVRSAVKVFKEMEMMDVLDDGTLHMEQASKMLGFETDWKYKKQAYREKKKLELEESTKEGQKEDMSDKSKSIELYIELDKELEKKDPTPKKESKHKHGIYKNVLLKDSEKEKLIGEWGEQVFNDYLKILDEGIELKGYKYKSHYLALRKWKERDKGETGKIDQYNMGGSIDGF